MKKISLFALVAGVLGFISCSQEAKVSTDGMFTQGQVDSIVDARIAEMRDQMALENDSIINVRAQEMADSIIAARSGKTVVTSKTTTTKATTKKPTTTTPTKPTTPTNPKESRFNGTQQTNTDEKAARFGDKKAEQKVIEENKKKKEERFK